MLPCTGGLSTEKEGNSDPLILLLPCPSLPPSVSGSRSPLNLHFAPEGDTPKTPSLKPWKHTWKEKVNWILRTCYLKSL